MINVTCQISQNGVNVVVGVGVAVVVDVGSVEVEAGTADVVELQENTLACVLQLTTTFPVAYAEAKKFNRASCRTFWFTHKAGFSFKPLKLQKNDATLPSRRR